MAAHQGGILEPWQAYECRSEGSLEYEKTVTTILKNTVFAALQMSEEAKEAKEFGLGKDHVNRLLDQTGRKFENRNIVVVKLAA